MGWITEQGTDYCEGDKPYGNYWLEIPNRPSYLHMWVNKTWVLDPAQVIVAVEAAIQKFIDDAAKARGYDSILSACSYATSKNSKFGAEGVAFRDWRDAVWVKCYDIQVAVQTGARAIPSVEQVIAELPPLLIF